MAEEYKDQEEELSENETEELEKLLSDAEEGDSAGGGVAVSGEAPKGFIQRLKSDKKFLLVAVAGLLLLGAGGGGAYWYFFMQAPPAEVSLIPEAVPESAEDSILEVQKTQLYSLDPFFLPLQDHGEETSDFIKVVPHLLMSNSALEEEVDKILPQIRRGIYNILRRTDPQDFIRNRPKTKEKIKSLIIMESNANLLSGTGSIVDVFYTEFMIK